MRRRTFIAGLSSAAAWLYALVSLAIPVSWPAPIEAHDIYTKLKNSAGDSCCNERDCHPAHYRVTASGVQMLVGGSWTVVPDDTIQYRALEGDTGETAGGHWCGKIEYGVTYCAFLPPSSASSTSGDPRQTLVSPAPLPTRSPNIHPAHQ